MQPTTSSADLEKEQQEINKMVYLRGASLKKFSSKEMKAKLITCSVVKKIKEVFKYSGKGYCVVIFKSNADAADFYHTYCGERIKHLCHQLPRLEIRPGCNIANTLHAQYNMLDYNRRSLDDPEKWCKCPSVDDNDVEIAEVSGEERRVAEELKASLERRIDLIEKELVLATENLKIVEKDLGHLQ
ncbi:unnamed protein product [Umbelopsis ramanniana]